ncbi:MULTISPECIES: extracellular solute-binding protein [Streptomyces]|uniref:extracellular solute-binding protein n=1 Tax=Streptomyces TaxID=1883 RepID=UPI00052613F1|nr:extracellular solute-binding protein [Streptomyces virginiae]MCX4714417.1 extracellular solute-binding protein [Streptomyces virginiae]MCX5272134.1 extracellular solute-binding protein [Streptomyces virginiae]WSC78350.1 extracellular solute-binding protein [Streptomyces virginiae]
MKGRYLSLAASGAALCLTAVTLTGCGAIGGLTGDNEVTLRVVAADYGDNPQNSSEAYWKDLAANFEKANPGTKVEVSVYSWSEVDAKVAEMVKAGKAPDIAQIGAYSDYAAAGKLYSAEELLSVKTEADFLGPLADAGKVKQVQYGMPFVSSTRLLFYNEKLLADAGVIGKDAKGWQPKSWADLEAAAKKLKAANVPTPFAVPLGREEAQAETMMWMLAGGGGYTDNEESYAIDSAPNVKALEFLRDKMVGQGLTGPVEPGKLDRQAAFEGFTKGEVGMLNGHPTLLKQAAAKGVKFGMVPLPTADGSDQPAMGVADWVMAFKNGHRQQSGKFLDFLYQPKNVTAFTEKYDLLPATTSGYQAKQAATGGSSAQLKPFLTALPSSRLYPVGKKSWAGVSEDIKQNIGKTVQPGGQPAKVLEQIATAARASDPR